jgi:hypothetical protein
VPLRVVPITLRDANAYVREHHRHHGTTVGHKFSVAVREEELLCGVAIAGRPVARMDDDGLTLEVLRLATGGGANVCSMLYGACWRAGKAMGYQRLVTFTLASEPGISLRAAGFRCLGERGGGSWSRSARPRTDKHPTELKLRWEIP